YAGVSDPTVYLHAANAETVTFAMIETRTALDNIDAIMAMPGIDAAFLGPSDLSITLTDGKVLDPHSKEVDAGVERIAEACGKARKIAGAFCAPPERALGLQKRGYRFIAIANDLAFLRAGTSAALKALKAGAGSSDDAQGVRLGPARGPHRRHLRMRPCERADLP